MRICDRCKDPGKANAKVLLDKREGTEFDLCHECSAAFSDFIAENPREQTLVSKMKQAISHKKKESKK